MIRIISENIEEKILRENREKIEVDKWLAQKQDEFSARLQSLFEKCRIQEGSFYTLSVDTGLSAESELGKYLIGYASREKNYLGTIFKAKLRIWNLVQNHDAVDCTVVVNDGSIIDAQPSSAQEIFIQVTRNRS